jgi:hypothetical protein
MYSINGNHSAIKYQYYLRDVQQQSITYAPENATHKAASFLFILQHDFTFLTVWYFVSFYWWTIYHFACKFYL